MSPLVNRIERITTNIGIIAALTLVPLILTTTYEVLARDIFDAPTIWAYEVGYMLTGTHFLLGMAYTLQQGQFIRIDIFSQDMSAKTRALIDLLYSLFLLADACFSCSFLLTSSVSNSFRSEVALSY